MQLPNTHKTRFSINGSGYFFKAFDEAHPLYQALRRTSSTDYHRLLFQIESFKSLELKDEKGKAIETFDALVPSKTWVSYECDAHTRLEIRRERSKSSKIMFQEFQSNNLLFPRNYQFSHHTLKQFPLLVAEYDKGSFGTASIPRSIEDEHQLTFQLLHVSQLNLMLVEKIFLDEDALHFRRHDTITYRRFVWLN